MRKHEMLGGIAGLSAAALLITGCTGGSNKAKPESDESIVNHVQALTVGAHVLASLSLITPKSGTTLNVDPSDGHVTYFDLVRNTPKAADGSYTEYRGDIRLNKVVSEQELLAGMADARDISEIEWSTWHFVASSVNGVPTGWTTLNKHVDGWATDHPLEQTMPGVNIPPADPSAWDQMLQ